MTGSPSHDSTYHHEGNLANAIAFSPFATPALSPGGAAAQSIRSASAVYPGANYSGPVSPAGSPVPQDGNSGMRSFSAAPTFFMGGPSP